MSHIIHVQILIYLVVTKCGLVGGEERRMFLQNIGLHLQDYTMSQPTRRQVEFS
jgi:hypothetical protein